MELSLFFSTFTLTFCGDREYEEIVSFASFSLPRWLTPAGFFMPSP
jgi:hypothetical protein